MKAISNALLMSCVFCAMTLQLSAQATRTWVSGVGDDANPCSRTAPCKTFAGAISKTAPAGEIDALDPGGFGAVTITKAITINGGGGQVASVLISGTNGIVVVAGATDEVILRNINVIGINNSTTVDTRGIKFLSGKKLVIENCDVTGMGKRGISIESSTAGAVATIINTTVHDNLLNGIVLSPPASTTNYVTLDHVRAVNNGFYGLGTNAGSNTAVRDSDISNNTTGGILADNSFVEIVRTSITGNGAVGLNGAGIVSQNSATVRMAGTTVVGNTGQFTMASGGVIQTYGDNYLGGSATGLTSVTKQ